MLTGKMVNDEREGERVFEDGDSNFQEGLLKMKFFRENRNFNLFNYRSSTTTFAVLPNSDILVLL